MLEPAIGGITGTHGGATLTELQTTSVLDNQVTSFLNSQSGYTTSKPKAFVNWVLFDEQFKYVAASSGFEQVGADNTLTTHTPTAINISKGGYLYIYVSNETPNVDVFFDNLQVSHIRGPILEETHYYPFGLTMAGISSKALAFGEPGNNRKWNVGSELASKEFSDGSGLELYETFYRSIDPQIGRFWQIDPEFEAQENSSPYESMGNNPISNMDPLGDFKTKFGAKWHRFWHGGGAVQKNEYDEWYVSKSKVEDDGNGGTVVKSWKYYGKGRDKYFTVREALLKDYAIMEDIQQKGDASMYQMYDSPEDAGKAALSLGVGVVLPNPVLKTGTNAANATQVVANGTTKVLSRAERLQLFKESILNAPMPKNPKEALKLINKILDKIEDAHAGANDRMYGILDKKYVTTRSDGGLTALTKGHRIEISTNGSFSIYERATGNLFLTK
ncbi:MAG: RHS repeat-associated core domain-containing protein [Chitinophagaceae bacterium]